jgi:acyl-CoA thioester hydrolase
MSKTYEYDLQVKNKHLDDLDHVNNVQYLQWVQDIAILHWKTLIEKETFSYGIWVVRRHEIDYKRPAKLDEWLTIKTYVSLTKDFISHRIVNIYFKETMSLVVQCKTQWIYLNAKTMKLETIPKRIIQLFN